MLLKFTAPLLIGLYTIMFLSACGSSESSESNHQVNTVLNYKLTGNGDKTLLFIHGWCIDQSYWDAQVDYFKGEYRILTLDLAGHGKSNITRDQWSISAYAQDVIELIDELELNNIVLIGHSMSGNVILHIYDKIPEKIVGFVGVDNLQSLGSIPAEDEKKQVVTYFEQMENDFPEMSREYALSALFSDNTPEDIKERVVNDITHCDPKMAVATLLSLIEEGKTEKEIAPKLNTPILLILSDNGTDTIVDHTSLQKYTGAGFQVFPIKGTGHYPMVEAPQRLNEQLENALQTIK